MSDLSLSRRHSAIALVAKLEQEGYVINKRQKTETGFAATGFAATGHQGANCTICNRPYHTKEECFAPGGGLSHLNRQERHGFLEKKRQRRTERAPPAAKSDKTDTANLVAELKAQLAEKNGKIAEQDRLMEDAKARVGGAIELGF